MAAKTELTGVVVRDKMAKSRVVAVERQVRDERYGKARRLTSTFMAHDEQNEFQEGDIVEIKSTRPYSKTKAWVVSRLVEKAKHV